MATKQKSGLYRSKIKIGVDESGKDVVKYISGRTKRELESNREKMIELYITGTSLNHDRLFGEYAVEWFQIRKSPFIAPKTCDCYRSVLNKHILPMFGDRNLRAIKPIEIQNFVNTFAGQSDTQISMIIAVLQGIYKSAVQDTIVRTDPTASIRRPAAAKPAEKRTLTPAERQRVESLFESHEYGLYLATMYYTGMRPGEVRGLQWGDIDWDNDLIHVQRDVDDAVHSSAGELKTRASDRYIPIVTQLRPLLWQQRGFPSAYVFPGTNGKPMASSTAKRIWLTLMRDCDLVEPVPAGEKTYYSANDIRGQYRALVTPHAMRHNFITMCWEKGVDLFVTMKLVGHTDYQTTRNIYTHLSKAHLAGAKEQISSVFENKLHKSCTAEKNDDFKAK